MIKLTGRIQPKRLFGSVHINLGAANSKLQAKTISPSQEDVTVFPDNGFTGLSYVIVEGATLQEKTVTPSSQEQTVVPDVGVYGLSKVIVKPQGEHGLLEDIIISPKEEEQVFTPPEGYYGIDRVTVEGAPLEEITIYPSYVEQRITPSEGYYGIGSILVEPMPEIDDPGGSGGDDDTGEDVWFPLTNADDVSFGNITTEEEGVTGYLYGDLDIELPALPSMSGCDYQCVFTHEDVIYCAMADSHFALHFNSPASDDICATTGGSQKTHQYRYSGNMGWVFSYTYENKFVPFDTMHWTSHDITNYECTRTIIPAGNVTEKMGTVVTTKPVEYDDLYEISGSSVNSLVTLTQQITGTTDTMTPSEAIGALEEYYAKPKAEELTY